ncbi:MAG: hypothetical protein GY851_27900 [bacterium]|nr:hypothetical protein [bacterium]
MRPSPSHAILFPAAVLFMALSLCPLAPASPGEPAEQIDKGNGVRVWYASRDENLAVRAEGIIAEALDGLADRLPRGDKPIEVVICPTMREFERFAGPYAQPKVSGVALPEKGVIAVKTPRIMMEQNDIAGTLRHELVHILLQRNVNVRHLPRWLNEGLAMTLSMEFRWTSSFRVGKMYAYGNVIALRNLDLAFLEPGRETEFGDAYAQAHMMTRHLRDQVGEDVLWTIVNDLDERTFAKALQAHASMTPIEFFETWESSLWKVALVFSIVSGFTLFQAMAILTVIAYVRKRRQGLQRMREWEEEEEDGPPFMTVGQLEDQDGPYPWEEEDEEYS